MITNAIEQTVSVNVRRAVATLTAAFAPDPAARWLYPDARQYQQHFPKFLKSFGGNAFGCRTADTMGNALGVALWLPPGVTPDETELDVLFASTVPEARQVPLRSIFEQMNSFHPEEPHWYLALIGVDPAHQGQGIGGALLEVGLQRCDRDRVPAYLESSNPRNIALYRRHGFEVIGRIQAGDSPEITPMFRPPLGR